MQPQSKMATTYRGIEASSPGVLNFSPSSFCLRDDCQTNADAHAHAHAHALSHVGRFYFFVEPGGKCLNILSTPLSKFLMFLSALLESVSLEVPLQISCFVLVSKRSTTTVPTVYVSVVVVASPKPPPPKRLQPQPPPNPS